MMRATALSDVIHWCYLRYHYAHGLIIEGECR